MNQTSLTQFFTPSVDRKRSASQMSGASPSLPRPQSLPRSSETSQAVEIPQFEKNQPMEDVADSSKGNECSGEEEEKHTEGGREEERETKASDAD